MAMSGKAASGEMMFVGDVIKGMGRGLDQVNLLEVVRYLKESRIAVKVSDVSSSKADRLDGSLTR